MRYLILILLFSFASYGQGPMYKASLQQGAVVDNLFDGANAADPENEVNGIANTSVSGSFPTTRASSSGDASNGTYKLTYTHANGTDAFAIGYVTIVNAQIGDQITFTVDVWETVGTNWDIQMNNGDGWVSTTTTAVDSPSGYTSRSVSGEVDSSPTRVRIMTNASGDAGDAIRVDNAVAIKTN